MRKVTKAPEGQAGYVIEGLPDRTYDEAAAKRLQYLKDDGSGELDLPADGVLAEVNPNAHNFDLRKDDKEQGE